MKALRYILIVLGLVILYASTSRDAMQYLSTKRDVNKWWGTDQLNHGDLASMSYLYFVDRFAAETNNFTFPKPPFKGNANIALYLHGDSYSRHLQDTFFAGVSQFVLIDRNHGIKYHLDSAKRNILLIEVSERYVRPYFGSLRIFNELISAGNTGPAPLLSSASPYRTNYAGFDISFDNLFNKYINQNIQCNLFNYQFMMPMFGAKAAINYYLFDRASGDVVISDDKKFLFLKETVSLTDEGSSYVPLGSEDISKLVDNFNAIYDFYKKGGFSEVYLSIIPNSVTINQPKGYNRLIPLIQGDPRLKMKIIDAYSAFRSSKDILYLTGDTHWNNKGRALWIQMVNDTLTHSANRN